MNEDKIATTDNSKSIRNNEFDDIRPYYDDEVNAALRRVAENISFPLLASFTYPGIPLDKVKKQFCSYQTTAEFQDNAMSTAIHRIIEESISEFTCDGLNKLSRDKHYLFVSNHRDIVLDSSLLQYFLNLNHFDTTEITFGANLMSSPMIIDLGKSNKMFRVERPGGSIKEFYQRSIHLSKYIRYAIKEKKQSVWIAQRNGRTKNGIDATDQGIIKMFCMSEPHDKIKALTDLNIVPMSISYEWESCDFLKTLELYESQFSKYTKKPGEDLTSVITGITRPKGRVHIEICEPISPAELESFEGLTNHEYHKAVATLLDDRINTAYRLYPNNYIAHDLRFGNNKYKELYTPEQCSTFIQRMERLNRYDTCDIEQLKDIFLGIYSNPVDNK